MDQYVRAYVLRNVARLFPGLNQEHAKGYLRDSGLGHHARGVPDVTARPSHPQAGATWEGMVVEEICRQLNQRGIGHDAFPYRTGGGAEVDLVIEGTFGPVLCNEEKPRLRRRKSHDAVRIVRRRTRRADVREAATVSYARSSGGDTIMIGPGRYSEYADHTSGTRSVCEHTPPRFAPAQLSHVRDKRAPAHAARPTPHGKGRRHPGAPLSLNDAAVCADGCYFTSCIFSVTS
jgi:hypothetical protein